MPAPKGNQFWRKRATSGRSKLFTSPETLWESACEYFDHCDANSFDEKIRPYTIDGLCIFLDVDDQTLLNYEHTEGYEEFFEVTKQIKLIIRDQKFTGAAVGSFNANIIARDLGLKDSSETILKASLTDLTDAELDRRLLELKREDEQSAES